MFYLKDYQAKEELYRSISKFKVQYDHSERTFDIKDFMKDRLEEYTGVQSL
jgi:hypothetical protein